MRYVEFLIVLNYSIILLSCFRGIFIYIWLGIFLEVLIGLGILKKMYIFIEVLVEYIRCFFIKRFDCMCYIVLFEYYMFLWNY